MTAIDDLRYLRERAVQEQQAATAAKSRAARQCHEQMAARYEANALQLAIGIQLSGNVPRFMPGMASTG